MADFKLNNIPNTLSQQDCKKEFAKFGKLSFIADFKDDKFNKGALFSFGKFKELHNKSGLIAFCQQHNILLTVENEKLTKIAKKESIHTNEKHQKSHDRNNLSKVKSEQPKQPKSAFIANPSFYFYKDKAYDKGIEDFRFSHNFKDFFEIPHAKTFELTTTYPGLLVGSGYNHPKLPENKEDFQLGFFFDHTTGLPLISGSGIKGLLRSVIKQKEFMQDVYGKTLSEDIFEDNKTIFYDAFILETKNANKKIFRTDYITSHYSNEENGMFKEPNPVKFLKVLPEVTFKFQFKAPKEHVELFKAIILDFGLGAKTNVGYGKFIEEQNKVS